MGATRGQGACLPPNVSSPQKIAGNCRRNLRKVSVNTSCGPVSFHNETEQIEVEDDYRICVRRGSEDEAKLKKKRRKMTEDDG